MEMARAVKPPAKRTYDSSRRLAQARETQAHIAETARALFIERGYTATSIRDIADAAGVAVQTIYNAFEGKPDVVRRIIDITVVGDDEPVALADRSVMQQILQETDPVRLVDTWAAFCAAVFVRFLPLLPVIREAAAVEPSVDEHWRRNAHDNRLAGLRAITERLGELDALPDDIDAERAADLLWVYVSFESAEGFIRHRGWSADAFARSSARTVKALFGIS